MESLAPIVIFTYTRLDTLKKTIKYLKLNNLARLSEIYIFSDGYKSKIDKKYVLKVRKYLQTIKGFKKINLIFKKKNFGLADNIVKGVSNVIEKHGKIIVLEDDIVVSSNFLEYMNFALNKYQSIKKVWHINSWNYNFKIDETEVNTFFTRVMNCWGWGTWKDRWKFFDKNPKKIIKNFSKKNIFNFNIENSYDFWSQIKRNKSGSINTWAIFWYVNIFENKGVCLSPVESLSKNIGYDNFSENIPNEQNSYEKIDKSFFLKKKKKFTFPKLTDENKLILNKIIKHLKNSKKKGSIFKRLIIKILNKLSFSSFYAANFFSKIFFLSNYNSQHINLFKVKSFQGQTQINLTRSPSFKLLVDAISIYKKKYNLLPKKILDIGGGLGENFLFLRKMYKIRINSTIIENETLVKIIKKNKIKHCNFTSNIKKINENFDMIILSATLEYVENPYALLKVLSNLTKKIIVIGRMNVGYSDKYKIQVSSLQQNVPYVENLPRNKNKIIFYPYKNLSIPKICKNLKNFKILSKKRDVNDKINIIFKKKI